MKLPRDTGGLGLLLARRVDRVVLQVALVIMALLWLFPIAAAVQRSFAGGGIENYLYLFTNDVGGISLLVSIGNSLIIGVLHATIVVVVSLLAGYGFSALTFPGKEAVYYSFIVMLAVPATAVLVPFYVQIRQLGLLNSHIGVAIAEAALTLPFAVMLVRNFADGLPSALVEAAVIDRASPFQVFRTVFLPFARPVVLNLSILCIVWSFQDYLFPTYFAPRDELTTAARAVQSFQGLLSVNAADIGRYNAALVLLAVPAVVLVALGIRHIASGMTAGAVKE